MNKKIINWGVTAFCIGVIGFSGYYITQNHDKPRNDITKNSLNGANQQKKRVGRGKLLEEVVSGTNKSNSDNGKNGERNYSAPVYDSGVKRLVASSEIYNERSILINSNQVGNKTLDFFKALGLGLDYSIKGNGSTFEILTGNEPINYQTLNTIANEDGGWFGINKGDTLLFFYNGVFHERHDDIFHVNENFLTFDMEIVDNGGGPRNGEVKIYGDPIWRITYRIDGDKYSYDSDGIDVSKHLPFRGFGSRGIGNFGGLDEEGYSGQDFGAIDENYDGPDFGEFGGENYDGEDFGVNDED